MPKQTTPRTIDELRALVMAISRKETDFTMGAKALSALGRLVEQPEHVAISTISELATSMDVNASTLSRLAKSLGYNGFPDFQKVFREAVARDGTRFYSDQASRLINGSTKSLQCHGKLATMNSIFQESLWNIESCLAELEPDTLDAVTEHLSHAKRVRVHGVRQIHAVAAVLAYGLGLIRRDVGLLDTPGQGIAENLANMEEGDVLVVASVSPYSRAVTETSEIARQRGLIVLAMTDYRTSPLAINAHHSFFIPHQSSFISNSLGAYIVLCEGLVNLVARKLGEKALQSLNRHEQLIEHLRIETG